MYSSTWSRGRRGRDRILVGFTTTYVISAYHHYSCEFEPRSLCVYSIKHYVIKFASDLRHVGSTSVSSTNKTDRHDIAEKHHSHSPHAVQLRISNSNESIPGIIVP